MTSTPHTMTAIVQPAYGLDAIEIGERPVPTAGPGQLRIKVAASALNPMDWHLATGSPRIVRLAEGLGRPKHEIPGREACGVVDQLGPGVTGFEIGQTVFGWVTGAFAEYTVAEADRMWPAPTEMTEFECAALPVAGATALEATERGGRRKRVVVNGASGGVGHYAVQIAKARGAQWVAGVCSSRNADFVRGLGADQVIEYDSDDFTSQRWDVVIDCIGNRTGSDIRRSLVDDGCWVVVGDHNKGGVLGPLPRLVARLMRWRFGSQTCNWFVQGEDLRYLEGSPHSSTGPGPLTSQRYSHDGRCAGWVTTGSRAVARSANLIAAAHRTTSTNAASTGREPTEANNEIGAQP